MVPRNIHRPVTIVRGAGAVTSRIGNSCDNARFEEAKRRYCRMPFGTLAFAKSVPIMADRQRYSANMARCGRSRQSAGPRWGGLPSQVMGVEQSNSSMVFENNFPQALPQA